MLYSDAEKVKLCELICLIEVKLQRESAYYSDVKTYSLQVVDGKGNQPYVLICISFLRT